MPDKQNHGASGSVGKPRPRIHNKKLLAAIHVAVMEHSGNGELADHVVEHISADSVQDGNANQPVAPVNPNPAVAASSLPPGQEEGKPSHFANWYALHGIPLGIGRENARLIYDSARGLLCPGCACEVVAPGGECQTCGWTESVVTHEEDSSNGVVNAATATQKLEAPVRQEEGEWERGNSWRKAYEAAGAISRDPNCRRGVDQQAAIANYIYDAINASLRDKTEQEKPRVFVNEHGLLQIGKISFHTVDRDEACLIVEALTEQTLGEPDAVSDNVKAVLQKTLQAVCDVLTPLAMSGNETHQHYVAMAKRLLTERVQPALKLLSEHATPRSDGSGSPSAKESLDRDFFCRGCLEHINKCTCLPGSGLPKAEEE